MPAKVLRLGGSCIAHVPGGARAFSPTDLVLTRAVGRGGVQAGPDVSTVQNALNEIPSAQGGPDERLNPDGLVGPLTIGAIEKFQLHHFGFKDGRVDVFGKTHAKLSSMRPAKLAFVNAAKANLNAALLTVRAAGAKLLQAEAELVTGGGLSGRRNLDLVDLHFGVLKSPNPGGAIIGLKGVYDRMLAVFARPGGLWGVNAFDADPFTEPDAGAFTFWGGFDRLGQFAGWQRLDAIYICEFYLTAFAAFKVFAIVHELAHFVGPASGDLIDDHAFGRSTDAVVKALPPARKQRNAQSFANFAFEARNGRSW
jgi:peptidoglycan hydrolase-like protein with peptidoglycan-binding domain